MANNNHKANQRNSNKGTKYTNSSYSKVHANRGAQLNLNNPKANNGFYI